VSRLRSSIQTQWAKHAVVRKIFHQARKVTPLDEDIEPPGAEIASSIYRAALVQDASVESVDFMGTEIWKVAGTRGT
jgi:hypothetical protein